MSGPVRATAWLVQSPRLQDGGALFLERVRADQFAAKVGGKVEGLFTEADLAALIEAVTHLPVQVPVPPAPTPAEA